MQEPNKTNNMTNAQHGPRLRVTAVALGAAVPAPAVPRSDCFQPPCNAFLCQPPFTAHEFAVAPQQYFDHAHQLSVKSPLAATTNETTAARQTTTTTTTTTTLGMLFCQVSTHPMVKWEADASVAFSSQA